MVAGNQSSVFVRRCPRCGAAQDRSWERCPRCPAPRDDLPQAAWLVPLTGPAAGQLWILGRRETLGSAPGNTRLIDDPYASGRHVDLSRSGERWLLRDLGSSNGSYVNAQRVNGAELRDGDLLQIGYVQLAFRSLGPPRRPELVAEATQAARVAWLVPVAGPQAGRTLVLPQPRCRLGTEAPAELCFADPYMSAAHAEIQLGGGPPALRDLRSTNGTYLNGRRVGAEPLLDGDQLRLGGTELVFKAA